MMGSAGQNPAPSLRDLYPHLSEEELAVAEDNMKRYLALVRQIFERMELEAENQARSLTPETGTLPYSHPDFPEESAN